MSWKTTRPTKRTRRSRALAPLLAILLIAAPAAAESAATNGARAVVEQTVADVLQILQEADLDTPARKSKIEAVALERFDFETMSRLVLARNWKRLSDTQKTEFVEEFTRHLSSSYGGRIERYEQESVDFLDERVEPRGDVTVVTRIIGGQADGVDVDYRLRQRNEVWRVIDVRIEGVSLVSSFRDQFKEVLSRGGPEELLRRLREKNTEMASSEA